MKLTDLAGTKTFKSWGSYFNHVKDTMSSLHAEAFKSLRANPSQMLPLPEASIGLKGHNMSTPRGSVQSPNAALSGVMSSMINNSRAR